MKNKISALMDGELDSTDMADIIIQINKTEELRNEWSTYHLIGDALRQPVMSTVDITSGIRKELAIEPTMLTSELLPKEKKGKFFAFAVAASVLTAVAAVTWMGGQTVGHPIDRVVDTAVLQTAVKTESTEPAVITAVPILAQKEELKTDKLFLQAAAQANSDVIPISAPIQLNDYMFVHEEFSPRTAIRGVSPYMRTVSDPYK